MTGTCRRRLFSTWIPASARHHGDQEGTVYNGHFGCTCYHPLILFNQFEDLERCSLRSGNVHSADDWEGVLKPVVVRYKGPEGTAVFPR